MRKLILAPVIILAVFLIGCQSMKGTEDDMAMDKMEMQEKEFTVTIEVLAASSSPVAPVAWAVHTGSNPIIESGMDKKMHGLEALAEDGNPAAVNTALAMQSGVSHHGVANTPEGTTEPAPAFPGMSYSFMLKAKPGDYLSFAAMYVQSNDLFYSTGEMGIPLFMNEKPVMGDVTSQVKLYDARTEVNEKPGEGPNQAPRQTGPNTGASEMKPVMPISDVMDGFSYPGVEEIIRVTIKLNEMM